MKRSHRLNASIGPVANRVLAFVLTLSQPSKLICCQLDVWQRRLIVHCIGVDINVTAGLSYPVTLQPGDAQCN